MGLTAVIFIIGAVTLDLFYLFKFAGRDSRVNFAGIAFLKKRRITLPVAALTLFTALLFTVPHQVSSSSPGRTPELSGMILGSLTYALAALLLLFFAVAHGKTGFAALFHAPNTSMRTSAWKGLVFGIAAIPPTMLITIITNQLITQAGYESASQPVIEWLTSPDTHLSARIAIVVSAVIVAPLAEELIFRGILFPAVLKNNSWLFSSLLTGCIFSLIHFHPPSFLSIFVLSLFFTAGYAATGSLITPIVMHMVFNATATFFTLLV